MNTRSLDWPEHDNRSIAGDVLRCVLRLLWQYVRLPLFLFLLTLEPVANLLLSTLALLGVLTAFFWKLIGPPGFHFFLVLTIALGFQFALLVYHVLLRVCSR